jgi:peptidoglycan/xylan/chitin deacetylase (PgdA/CDA1 family)
MLGTLAKRGKQIIPQRLLIQRLNSDASNCVLLTFDDGPHPEVTPEVLKRLEKYEARAIFFIPGRRIERAPHLLKLIQEQGHLIGNHTYIHSNRNQPWFLAYWRDLLQCQSLIEENTGKRPRLFRPSGGKITPAALIVPWVMGLKTMIWSLDVSDWKCRKPEEAHRCGEDLCQQLVPGDIVLLHDDNPNVLIILDHILPFMKSNNFDVASAVYSF